MGIPLSFKNTEGTCEIVPLVRLTLLLLALCFQSFGHASESNHKSAQTALHILDYLSVDYGGTVFLEKVINESEYKEQLEFSKQAVTLLKELPENPSKPSLLEQAKLITGQIQSKTPAELVRETAQNLRREIIEVYRVPVAPDNNPDLKLAANLFSQNCAKCHGPEGYGDGPDSEHHFPRPANFHDIARMGQRNVFGFYNTITLGVSGTAMESHPELSDDERWSLAFYVSNLRNSSEYIQQGRKYWEGRAYRGPVPNLTTLAALTSNDVSVNYGEKTRAVYAYLRAYPEALAIVKHSTLQFATEQLDKALAFYKSGNQTRSLRFSVDAYLEGFDPMEISLDNLDKNLRLEIEREMRKLRQLISNGSPVTSVEENINHTKALLSQADELLRAGKLSATGAFFSSFFILLREGIEGMLMLAAIITLAVRSGHHQLLKYVHAGLGGALFLGAITLMLSIWLVDISGAQREITEGVTALIASAMLIYVGFWLHDKANALSWNKFLHDRVSMALEKKMIWALALISFFAIYREVFESVLFYQALWVQVSDTSSPALWNGFFAAAMTLFTVGWLLFRLGIKLPLGLFFASTSVFLGIMAVVFAGQGISALQDANIVTSSPVSFFALPMLGIHPTLQTLLGQIAVICILALCYRLPYRRQAG